MKINMTARGRKGSLIHNGAGRLSFEAEHDHEAMKLKVLGDEIVGNLGWWTSIMWAAKQNRLTQKDIAALEKIVGSVIDDFRREMKEAP